MAPLAGDLHLGWRASASQLNWGVSWPNASMRVLVLSGSGLSADSGLPTFRGAGGLYEGTSAEDFLSAATYARDPEAVEAWLDTLRAASDGAAPNAAHAGLAA